MDSTFAWTPPSVSKMVVSVWYTLGNITAYMTLIVPIYVIGVLLRRSGKYDDPHFRRSILGNFLWQFYVGRASESTLPNVDYAPIKSATKSPKTSNLLKLTYCFLGLQISYLTWGVLQEKMMTQGYPRSTAASSLTSNNTNATTDRFTDSQFLVLVNRAGAFLIAAIFLMITRKTQPESSAPTVKYGYCSISNVISSYCQYEALKYVTFPTQVLAKTCKVIPVMLMGRCVSKKTYPYHQYATASLICSGLVLFLLNRDSSDTHSKRASETTTMMGVMLMTGYLLFDSFTSNWQDALYKQYKMSSVQMMCNVNACSSMLTLVALIQQGKIGPNFTFLLTHPSCMTDCILLAICSAIGQLFIYYTIEQFGAVTFTLIMTVRQALAIFISCLYFGHYIGPFGLVGIFITFAALFIKKYVDRKYR